MISFIQNLAVAEYLNSDMRPTRSGFAFRTKTRVKPLEVFVAPAVLAGFYATLGIVKLTLPSVIWQLVFSINDATAAGMTTFLRLAVWAAADPAHRNLVRA